MKLLSLNTLKFKAFLDDVTGVVGKSKQARANKLKESPPNISKVPFHPNASVNNGIIAAYIAIPVVAPIDVRIFAVSLYFRKYRFTTVIKAT